MPILLPFYTDQVRSELETPAGGAGRDLDNANVIGFVIRRQDGFAPLGIVVGRTPFRLNLMLFTW